MHRSNSPDVYILIVNIPLEDILQLNMPLPTVASKYPHDHVYVYLIHIAYITKLSQNQICHSPYSALNHCTAHN